MYVVIVVDTSFSNYGACQKHVPAMNAVYGNVSYEQAYKWANNNLTSLALWDILKVGE